jgi:hypothetical protein
MLSIFFSGNLSGGGLGVRGFVDIQKALTIDLHTGNVLSLGDFVDFCKISYILRNYPLAIMYSGRELQYHLQTQFLELLENGNLLSDTRYFYIRENMIGLIGWDLPMRDRIVADIYMGDRWNCCVS